MWESSTTRIVAPEYGDGWFGTTQLLASGSASAGFGWCSGRQESISSTKLGGSIGLVM